LVKVESRYLEDEEEDLHEAADSVTRATMGALQKQIRAAGFKGAQVSGFSGLDTHGRPRSGFAVHYQGKEYDFSIDETELAAPGKFSPLKGLQNMKPNFSLTESDKKVIRAFVAERSADSRLLQTDGRKLEKHGLGSEVVARWVNGRIAIVSTESVKSDESIIRLIVKTAGPGIVDFSYARKGHRTHGHGAMGRNPALDDFTQAFFETALWSTNDESNDAGGDPLDENYSIDDIDPASLAGLAAECARFQEENAADLAVEHDFGPDFSSEGRAGHDFWLTRCGHGAGFWDGDWPEPQATRLTEASEKYGNVDLYVGDDGVIYASGYESPREQTPNGRRTGILSDGTRVNAYQFDDGIWTIVPHSMAWDSMVRGKMREMLELTPHGSGTQWTSGQEGRHLGRSVPWETVPANIKNIVEQRVVGDAREMASNGRRKKITAADLPSGQSTHVLMCPGCHGEYSADRSDYFQLKPSEPLVCGNCGEPLKLVKRAARKPTQLEQSWAEDDYVVSVIDRDGSIGLFRVQRGRWADTEPLAVGYKLDQISGAAEEDARARGVQDAVIFDGDEGRQIGHVLHGRWQVDMTTNARGSTVDEQAATELSLYIENEYSLIGAANSIGKSIDANLRKKVANGSYDSALAPKAWEYLIEAGAKKYSKEYSAGNDWSKIFSAATRRKVAQDFARAWEQENIAAS
jgi:hypothetical protein